MLGAFLVMTVLPCICEIYMWNIMLHELPNLKVSSKSGKCSA